MLLDYKRQQELLNAAKAHKGQQNPVVRQVVY